MGRAMAVEHEFPVGGPLAEGEYDAQIGRRVTLQYAMVLVGLFGIDGECERERPLTSR